MSSFSFRKNTAVVWGGMQELWTRTTDVRQELSPHPETQSKLSRWPLAQAKVPDLTRQKPYFIVVLPFRSQHERSPNVWRFTTCGKSRSALTYLCSRIVSGRKSTAATQAWRKSTVSTPVNSLRLMLRLNGECRCPGTWWTDWWTRRRDWQWTARRPCAPAAVAEGDWRPRQTSSSACSTPSPPVTSQVGRCSSYSANKKSIGIRSTFMVKLVLHWLGVWCLLKNKNIDTANITKHLVGCVQMSICLPFIYSTHPFSLSPS